jgi:hypothetical protein
MASGYPLRKPHAPARYGCGFFFDLVSVILSPMMSVVRAAAHACASQREFSVFELFSFGRENRPGQPSSEVRNTLLTVGNRILEND